jgi:hypothetical protein
MPWRATAAFVKRRGENPALFALHSEPRRKLHPPFKLFAKWIYMRAQIASLTTTLPRVVGMK